MKPPNRKLRGIALLLVMVIVALASLIGFALLSSASLQAQVAESGARSAAAEYLAESAVQAAIFYLANPSKVPGDWDDAPGYVLFKQNGVIAGVSGSFDVQVTPSSSVSDAYEITAVGRSGASLPATRATTVTVQPVRAKPDFAAGFGGAVDILSTGYVFNGPVSALGAITGWSGTLQATSYVLPGNIATVNHYGAGGGTYTMPDGTTGTPQNLGSGTITTIPAPAPNNPGKVFYSTGELTLSPSGSLTINGTLIVPGSLTIVQGKLVTITREPGFPALIVDNQLRISGKNTKLVVNGVTWLGGINWVGMGLPLANCAGSTVTVNGALLAAAGAKFEKTLSGSFTANYVPAYADAVNLTATPQPVVGMKILNWQQ